MSNSYLSGKTMRQKPKANPKRSGSKKSYLLATIAIAIGLAVTSLSYLVERDGWWLPCDANATHDEAYTSNEKVRGYPASYYREAYPKNCSRDASAAERKGHFNREKFTYDIVFWSSAAGAGVIVLSFAADKLRREKR